MSQDRKFWVKRIKIFFKIRNKEKILFPSDHATSFLGQIQFNSMFIMWDEEVAKRKKKI